MQAIQVLGKPSLEASEMDYIRQAEGSQSQAPDQR